MSEWSEFSWLIGILEGEGNPFGDETNYPRVTLQMNDEDTINRALSEARKISPDVGEACPLNLKSGKTAYRLTMYGDDAISLMRAWLPHASARRAGQIRKALVNR